MLDAGAYSPSLLSAPYVVLAVAMAVFTGYLLFTRGNPLLRMPLLAAAAPGLMFAPCQAAAASCVVPGVAPV